MNGGVARLLLIREARDPYVATKRPAPGLYEHSAGSMIRGRHAPAPNAERELHDPRAPHAPDLDAQNARPMSPRRPAPDTTTRLITMRIPRDL